MSRLVSIIIMLSYLNIYFLGISRFSSLFTLVSFFGLLFFCWVSVTMSGYKTFRFMIEDLALLFFTIALFISFLASPFQDHVTIILFNYLIAFLIYFIVRVSIGFNYDLIVSFLFSIFVVYALFSIIEIFNKTFFFAAISSFMYEDRVLLSIIFHNSGRIGGLAVYNTPNAYILSCGLAIGLTKLKPKVSPIRYILVLLLFLPGIVLSGGKTGFFGFFLATAASILILIFSRKRNFQQRILRLAIIITFLLLLLITILINPYPDLLQGENSASALSYRYFYSFENSLVPRLELYELSLRTFSQSPVFGIGLGGFQAFSFQERGIYQNSHNLLLQILAETGLIGILCFLVFMIGVFLRVIKAFLNCSSQNASLLFLCMFVQILFWTHSFTSNPFYTPSQLTIFVTFSAIGLSVSQSDESYTSAKVRRKD